MRLLANRLYLGGLFAEEDATTPWRNEPIRAGLALALTDVQHHPQCPLWVQAVRKRFSGDRGKILNPRTKSIRIYPPVITILRRPIFVDVSTFHGSTVHDIEWSGRSWHRAIVGTVYEGGNRPDPRTPVPWAEGTGWRSVRRHRRPGYLTYARSPLSSDIMQSAWALISDRDHGSEKTEWKASISYKPSRSRYFLA